MIHPSQTELTCISQATSLSALGNRDTQIDKNTATHKQVFSFFPHQLILQFQDDKLTYCSPEIIRSVDPLRVQGPSAALSWLIDLLRGQSSSLH